MRSNTSSQKGFTLVEVAVIVPGLILVALTLFMYMFDIVVSSSRSQTEMTLIHDKQTALNVIEEDIVLTTSYLGTITSGIAEPYPPTSNGNSWLYKGDSATSRALILQAYSTTTHPQLGGASGRKPVYVNGGSCSLPAMYNNAVQKHNIVYFVKNEKLYRRTLIVPTTTTPLCSPGQYQKLSCPSQEDLIAQGQVTRDGDCGADDELIASNVTNFAVNYYASTSATTPQNVYVSSDQSSLVMAAVDAEVTLTLSKRTYGENISTSSTMRMSRLNRSNQ